MRLMDKDTQDQVRNLLAAVQSPVTIHMFTQDFECGYCKETRQIAEEVTELSDQVTLQIHDFIKDQSLAEDMGIDKIPALAINGTNDRDFGIRTQLPGCADKGIMHIDRQVFDRQALGLGELLQAVL